MSREALTRSTRSACSVTVSAAGSTMASAVSSSSPRTQENTSNSFSSHDTGFAASATRYVITVVL